MHTLDITYNVRYFPGPRTQMTATTTASTLNNLSQATSAAPVGSGSGSNSSNGTKQLNGGWFDVQLKTISHKVQQDQESYQQTPAVPSTNFSNKRLFFVFSACGGIHNYASFDSLLSHAGLEHLGKGWTVRGTTTGRLTYWASGLFYPI